MQLMALALIATVLPLSANSDNQQPAGATAQPISATQMVCRPAYHDGMLVRRAECHTQGEWDRIVKRNERDVQDFQQRGMVQLNH